MSLWSFGAGEERKRGEFEACSLLGFAKTFHTLCLRQFSLDFIENQVWGSRQSESLKFFFPHYTGLSSI